ncbi:transmembrane protein 272-like [Symphorus nematophorus]
MNRSEQLEIRLQGAALISVTVVLNIIWWMLMIAAIGLGATHLNSCPVEPRIPIYLIVLGSASLIALTVTYLRSAWDDGCVCILSSFCTILLHLYTFIWLITGSSWIYPIYPPNYTLGDKESRYCHRTIYLFAFIVTTLTWVSIAVMFVCGCCCLLVTCCTTINATRRLIPNRNTFYGATSEAEEPTAGDV